MERVPRPYPGARSATRRAFVGLGLTAIALLACGCDEMPTRPAAAASPSPPAFSLWNLGARSSAPSAKSALVAFVGSGEGDPLWPVLKAGAERYADRVPAVRLRFVNPHERSADAQARALEALRDLDLRGLCIRVTDAEPLLPILREFHNRGVSIISMIQPIPREIRAGHVGLNDSEIGKTLAEVTMDALDGGGSIALLHAGHEHPIFGDRRIGFEQAIRMRSDIEVFTRKDCQADPGKAREMIRAYSKRFPRLSAWVALGNWPLQDGEAGDDLGIPPGCSFIPFGGTPEQWPLIEAGISNSLVAADYGELGYRAARFCEAGFRESSRFERRYEAPLRIVDRTNLDAYKRDWSNWCNGKPTETRSSH